MADPGSGPPQVTEPAPEPRAAGPGTILVVEDYRPVQHALAACLRSAGFRVAVAESASAALRLAMSTTPDAIVMDLSLPVIDGAAATQMLKTDERTRDIPVIAVSSQASKRQDALDSGCVDFVEKPYSASEIEQRIRTLLRGKPKA